MVVLVRDGKIELPSEAEGFFSALTPEMITSEYAHTRTAMNTASGALSLLRLQAEKAENEEYYEDVPETERYEHLGRTHIRSVILSRSAISREE